MSTVHKYDPNWLNLDEARRVLMLEAHALQSLQTSLDDQFLQAIQVIHDNKGHVIVTGMGKSGHVARKIAATLASTGTPAFFVHPAEASHGDLGMISPHDIIMALSNSGETAELSDLVSFSKRFNLPLIAVTQNPQSTLAMNADIVLLIPLIEEACPLGLAPTTSTTMMMALGDAIATTLLKYRGFSPSDFGNLHPGGKLGQKLIKVAKIMHRGDKMPLVPHDTIIQNVLITMTTYGFGMVGLVDATGILMGVITDGDLRRHMSADLLSKTAMDIMTADPYTLNEDMLAEEALALMNNKQVLSCFILDKKVKEPRPIGIIHIHDCLRIGLK